MVGGMPATAYPFRMAALRYGQKADGLSSGHLEPHARRRRPVATFTLCGALI